MIPDYSWSLDAVLSPGLGRVVRRVTSCLRIGSIPESDKSGKKAGFLGSWTGVLSGNSWNKCVFLVRKPEKAPSKVTKDQKSVRKS